MRAQNQHQITWRDNWFVKNILAETLIIGGFFKTSNVPQALHHVGIGA